MSRFLLLFLIAFLMVAPAVAQDDIDNGDIPSLSATQQLNSISVADAWSGRLPVREGQSITYRLADCDLSNPDLPCYFVVSATADPFALASISQKVAAKPAAQVANATLICGVDAYSGAGVYLGKLVQRVNASFWTTANRAPVTLNWGDLSGTYAHVVGYWWDALTGPTPNPSYGVRANSSAYANSTGKLTLGGGGVPIVWQQSFGVALAVNTGGWYCL